MWLEQSRNWSTCLLPTKVRLILEVSRYIDIHYDVYRAGLFQKHRAHLSFRAVAILKHSTLVITRVYYHPNYNYL